MTSDARRLHPFAFIVFGIEAIKKVYGFLVGLIIPTVIWANETFPDFGWKDIFLWGALGVAVIIGIASSWGLIAWRRYTYRVECGELRLEYGVLIRKKRFIPLERIQAVDIEEPLVHRLLRIVTLKVETAGSRGEEANIAAISRNEATRLQHALTTIPAQSNLLDEALQSAHKQQPVEQVTTIRRLNRRELFVAGVTSGGVGIVLSLIGGIYSVAGELLPLDQWFAFVREHVMIEATVMGVLIVAIVVFIFSLVAGIVTTAITYGNFILKRDGEHLIVERGIIERKRSTIPLARIQAIRLVEGVFRQPFGYVTVHVESAGYGLAKDETTVLFPLLKRTEVASFLQTAVPEFALAEDIVLYQLPRRALRRSVIRWTVPVVPVAVALPALSYPWGFLSVAVIPLALLYGWFHYRDARWGMKEKLFVVRMRRIARTTAITTRRRVQSCTCSQTVLQRRARMASFAVNVASGASFRITDVFHEDGERLVSWARNEASICKKSLTHDLQKDKVDL